MDPQSSHCFLFAQGLAELSTDERTVCGQNAQFLFCDNWIDDNSIRSSGDDTSYDEFSGECHIAIAGIPNVRLHKIKYATGV